MYGTRKYNRIKKVVPPQAIPPGAPTFICSKCKIIRQLSSQYSDISLTLKNKTIACYRICEGCFSNLTIWIKQ